MKLMSLLFIAVATQYSCINDADVANPDNLESGSKGNLALFLEIPNDTKSARDAESSGNTETGTPEEYAVKAVTLYLFDSATKVLAYSFDLKNIQKETNTAGKIKYSADKVNVKPGMYNIFAIANGKAAIADISTQDKFLEAIDEETYKIGNISNPPSAGFVMSNRGNANLNVQINESLQEEDKVTNVTKVSIGLERVVAKIQITQRVNLFELKDDKGVYATININNFRMMNLANKFYTFRHTAVLEKLIKPDTYTDVNFGDINPTNGYVIDPYFFEKTKEKAPNFSNKDKFYTQALVEMQDKEFWAGMSTAGSWSTIYCLENCMFQTAQFNAFTTGIMFRATIDIAHDRVFNEKKQNGLNPDSYDKLFYFNHNFYTSIEAVRVNVINSLPKDITDSSTPEDLKKYSIKRFPKIENYFCYYNYWIKHSDNNDETNMGVMEFGIVRNNIYKITVIDVADLGTGEPDIDPGNPDEPKALLKTDFDVYEWVVRDQGAVLE